MKIGIGLPNPVRDLPGSRLPVWAQRAEARGFAGLATIDRIVYPSYDSLTTLAAAGGATSRITLLSNIVLAPAYPPVILAKAAASIDQISGGRFTLGVAPGGRADDYAAVGRDFQTRGRDFDAQLALMHRMWRGEPLEDGGHAVTPPPVNQSRVPVLIGGASDAAIRRTVSWAEGWTSGGVPPEMAAPFVERVHTAWRAAGRAGAPRLAALAYFSLGADADQDSRAYLRHYYSNLGPYADTIAENALRAEADIRAAVQQFTDVGFTELYFDPTTAALDQVDRLADIVL